MAWWMAHHFSKRRAVLEQRSDIIHALRCFFKELDFTEVQTPVLQACPVMDAHIHGFKTQILGVDRLDSRSLYLQTSPEFDMKKLLVAGMERIYQICPVFRNAEASPRHVSEFTMLEWYRAGADYRDIMDDCINLLRYVAAAADINTFCFKDSRCDPFAQWKKISVSEAFVQYADIELDRCIGDLAYFKAQAQNIGVRLVQSDQWDDIFHAIMADKIESFLGVGAPTILYDYPVSMAGLSRVKDGNPRYAERFELYVCGMELANAFSELTDAAEQRRRFAAEMDAKDRLYGERYPADDAFFAALDYGMPESGGIALGVDRLVMLITGADDIEDVLWAPVPRV